MAVVQRRFEGKVVLITGGNIGIGLATAKAFAAEGANIMIAARRRRESELAIEAIADMGGEAAFVETDVVQAASVQNMVSACVKRFGRLDVAFNNAGVTGGVQPSIVDMDEETFDEVMAVNAKGVWLCMKYEIPEMLKVGGGAIINCGSFSGIRATPESSAYTASKHAVVGLTRAVAVAYAAQNIRVNAICPGMTMTELISSAFANAPEDLAATTARVPMKRAGAPDEMADAVVWLASPQSKFITGQVIPIDGGISV